VLEAELVQRARLLEANDSSDFATHRRQHPDDPLPALVLVADGVSLEQAGRLAPILAQGPRLGVGALLPGTAVDVGAQLVLDEAGRVQSAAPWALGDQQLAGARACALTPDEAAELLRVLVRSRTDDDLDDEVPEPSHPDTRAGAAVDQPAGVAPAAEPVVAGDGPDGLPAEYGKAQALVRVRLLGPLQITTESGEIRSGLRASARELLAYYLVHPDGATLEQAVEAMWPDTELGRERERFWTALGNLRTTLRKATGATELKAIERDGARYRLDLKVFAVDLWRFHQALAAARRAQLEPAVAAALAEAGEAYGGCCWTAPPTPGSRSHGRTLGVGRSTPSRAWPSCARPLATWMGHWQHWSKRWTSTRSPRSFTAASCGWKPHSADPTRSSAPIGCWPASWPTWMWILTLKLSSSSPSCCAGPVRDLPGR
jgi:hypothetical protein